MNLSVRRGKCTFASAALLLPMICFAALVVASAATLIPLGQWTIYRISNVVQNSWSSWYSVAPWPVRFRFKCSKGAVVVDASNTSHLQQGVQITAWDIEATKTQLDQAVASGRAEQSNGITLLAGQSAILNLYRPALCGAPTQDFVFAAVYSQG
jgi:hypothetical protein